jgi:hypothetical protein
MYPYLPHIYILLTTISTTTNMFRLHKVPPRTDTPDRTKQSTLKGFFSKPLPKTGPASSPSNPSAVSSTFAQLSSPAAPSSDAPTLPAASSSQAPPTPSPQSTTLRTPSSLAGSSPHAGTRSLPRASSPLKRSIVLNQDSDDDLTPPPEEKRGASAMTAVRKRLEEGSKKKLLREEDEYYVMGMDDDIPMKAVTKPPVPVVKDVEMKAEESPTITVSLAFGYRSSLSHTATS